MYVCKCMHIHVCIGVLIHACIGVEARGQCWLLSSIVLSFTLETGAPSGPRICLSPALGNQTHSL